MNKVELFDDITDLAIVIAAIIIYNGARDRRKLLKDSLVHPKISPWAKLLGSANADCFLEITGFTIVAFRQLVHLIYGDVNDNVIRNRGRPYTLDENARVGLCLLFLGSTMKHKYLCMIFGCAPTIAENVELL